jgi:hypothetical protein
MSTLCTLSCIYRYSAYSSGINDDLINLALEVGESHTAAYPMDIVKYYGRPNSICTWCGETKCEHCKCGGHYDCGHKPGEQCSNNRYTYRSTCNHCMTQRLKKMKTNGNYNKQQPKM